MNRPARWAALRLTALVYGVVDFAVILAPAAVVYRAAQRGGLDDAHALDLVVASSALGAVHATLAFRWLRNRLSLPTRRHDSWIAALNALVVLAIAATLLLLGVLEGFADEHATLARRGYPVVALWVGVQTVAVALGAATGRAVLRWLRPRGPHLAATPPDPVGTGPGSTRPEALREDSADPRRAA